MKIGLYLFAGLGLIPACWAEIAPVEGLWESTGEIPLEQKNMYQQMPPEALKQMQKSGMKIDPQAGTMTMSYCLNKEKLSQWHQMGKNSQQKCDKPQISNSGNTVTMDMVCHPPQAGKMHSVIQFNAARDQYQYTHTITSAQGVMTMRGHAKRLGHCKQ